MSKQVYVASLVKTYPQFGPLRGIQVEWGVPYTWSPIIPASMSGPEEGGVEPDSDPFPVSMDLYLPNGDIWEFPHIEAGSVMAIILGGDLPTNDECYRAAAEDWTDNHNPH